MASSYNGPIFLKVVDALGKYKDAQYIFELFIKVIEEVDVDYYVQIIKYNAHICKFVDMIMETKYPQILWTPCMSFL